MKYRSFQGVPKRHLGLKKPRIYALLRSDIAPTASRADSRKDRKRTREAQNIPCQGSFEPLQGAASHARTTIHISDWQVRRSYRVPRIEFGVL
jgi:hypothetical protein